MTDVTTPPAIPDAPKSFEDAELRLEYVPVHELIPASRNPKRHDLPTLRKSIKRFGYAEPVIVDDRTGRLVSGHGRTETLRDLEAVAPNERPRGVKVVDGRWAIPVIRGWSSENDDEAEAFIVAANRIPELGGWDDTVLDDILAGVADAPDALDGVGFEPPQEDIPHSKEENLTPLRWSHVLLSYPVDRHGDIAKVLAELEKDDQVTIRSTVNDMR